MKNESLLEFGMHSNVNNCKCFLFYTVVVMII